MKTLLALFLAAVLLQVQPKRSDAFVDGEVARLEQQSLESFKTGEGRAQRLREALEMFGLAPMPERGDLKPVITGRIEDDTVAVEKLHFQSSPGLYVTANFYLPKTIAKPLPAILYVCGHSNVRSNNISFGNKAGYGHHGAWFARNGYACLVIDTVQLGEIPGIHHGTYREGMWWWNSRGFSSAATEAWNGIRALDYLESRPEVDKTRIGVTGRSGGGAYSWSAITLDPRVKAAAPVAGITDLRNHVIDGCVEGHCDCMYFVNTYAWDYHMLAALAAPKPLLIVNTDKDSIFPLDGVYRIHTKIAGLYRHYGNTNDFGLVIGPGPHKDTQDLQVPVFRWFNHYLRGEDPMIDLPATNHFTPAQLRVFTELPADERNTTVHEWFVPKAPPGPPISSREEWQKQREIWMSGLREKVFRNWPKNQPASAAECLRKEGAVFVVGDPRPIGHLDAKAAVQLRRRYMLTGHTMDSMRVYDIVRAVAGLPDSEVTLEAEGSMAVNALFASLFAPKVKHLILKNLPASLDRSGPDYLNVLRVLDIREALAVALESASIRIEESKADVGYARGVADKLGWNTGLQ